MIRARGCVGWRHQSQPDTVPCALLCRLPLPTRRRKNEIPVSYGHGQGWARGDGKGSAKSARTGAADCQLPLQEGLRGLLGTPPSLTAPQLPA